MSSVFELAQKTPFFTPTQRPGIAAISPAFMKLVLSVL
jgi:hypothetical protein